MEVSASFMHEFISPPLLFQHDVHPKLCIPNPDMLYLTISKKKPQFSAGMRGGAIIYLHRFGKETQESKFSTFKQVS